MKENAEPFFSQDQKGILNLLYKEAFKRIGKEVIIQSLYAKRSLVRANAGEADGDALRLKNIHTLYPNLIRVPEPIWEVQLAAFTKSLNIKIKGWGSLKGYRIGYLNGWAFFDLHLNQFKYVHKSEYLSSLLLMLDRDRIDILLHSKLITQLYIKKNGLTSIKMLQPVLKKQPAYLYLHKKHKQLVPALAMAFHRMKTDGNYEQAQKKMEQLIQD
ncbi:substrate-binding periplasmic protein [Zooshikella harenae]|uniref:Transporter substrate-binding domain-containing protein n=1 Tax=Zooshikella harenae TaxID=2827238 RepID=A0ABS5ZGW1_9GAMM|nr:transporter substrate-binding domain-containing protein [Zooshikella harenae]MBU2713013.1 transporter substrate-binding domain-containing protein [Zooshikella harenae]